MGNKSVESSELRVESKHAQLNDALNVAILLAFIDLRNSAPLQRAAAALRAQAPDSRIICINAPATKAIETQIEGIDRWITFEGGYSASLQILRDLRHLRPEATCILYQIPQSHAHLKLEVMAAAVGGSKLLGAFSTDCTKLQPMNPPDLWLRIAGKTLLMLLRAGASAALSAFVGLFLAATSLLTRPGERLGMPGVGRVR